MSTTIGEAGKTQEEARVGFSVEWAVKVIRKAESWLCPCRRMGVDKHKVEGPFVWVCFELWDSRMEINKSHSETGKRSWTLENQVAKPLGGKSATGFKGKEETSGPASAWLLLGWRLMLLSFCYVGLTISLGQGHHVRDFGKHFIWRRIQVF